MQLNRAPRDGKPQADAAAGAVAVRLHAVEGVEQARQGLFGNARAGIANVHNGVAVVARQGNADRFVSRANSGWRCE